jgi:carbon monoxide dehydrogenase subunit G
VVRIDFTVEVARPPQEVFELMTDLARLPEWQASAVESKADGALHEGARIAERRRVMGRELETQLEVTGFDPPRQLTLKALNGPIRFTVDHRLAEADGGTRLRVVAEGKAGGFMKLGQPMLARTAEAELRKDFERLKELLEG